MPVLIENSDVCRQQQAKQYAVYADQTVYGFTIVTRNSGKAPDFCSPKKNFDANSFTERVAKLKTEVPEFTESSFEQNSLTVIKIAGKMTTYWLINDYKNKRWFEMWVTKANDEKPEVQNFFKSVEINKTTQGIEIGNGADRTLGDDTAKTVESEDKETNELRVVFKPIPTYTKAAKKDETKGIVLLKVFFLANGGIGSIIPVIQLPNGLTEQSILAAQRIVFIPPRRNGVAHTVVKRIQYDYDIF